MDDSNGESQTYPKKEERLRKSLDIESCIGVIGLCISGEAELVTMTVFMVEV